MKKTFIKVLTFVFGFVLVFGLYGCGKKGEARQEAGSMEKQEASATEDSKEQETAKDQAETQERQAVTITVYSTNDLHGVVSESPDDGVIGLPLVSAIAASTENAVLLDAGDATQGASFATVESGLHVIHVMNAAGYAAMAAGNHEFDYGTETLLANAREASFPILSANTQKEGEPLLDGHVIVTVGGLKIGIVGITTVSTATSTNPAKLEGITFADEIDTLKQELATLKGSVEAVIVLAHLGDNPLAANVTSQQLLEGLTQEETAMIAAVIDGHSHTMEQTDYHGIPILQTGCRNTSLGVTRITFDEKGNFQAQGEIWDYETASGFSLNAAGEAAKTKVQQELDACILDLDPILAEEAARTGAPIWGGYIYYDYAEPRVVETTMGDMVTDAFRYYGEIFAEKNKLSLPVIGIENGGGISATFPYGIVTRGDILNAFNHGNTVDVIQVAPAQLYAAIEGGLVTTGQDDTGLLIREAVSGSFLQVSGITYTYDPAGETGKKVVSVVLDDGTELSRDDEETQLLVATNNYVTTFDGFNTCPKLGELGGEDGLVMDYILYLTNGGEDTLTIDHVQERIMIANDTAPATYEVVIPVMTADGDAYDFSGMEFEIVIDNDVVEKVICQEDGIPVTVSAGPHTIYLTESYDAIPVYVNNYSGSGTVTTASGYFHFYFTVDPEEIDKK